MGGYILLILYSLSVAYMFAVDYLGIEKLLVQFPAQVRLFIVGILLYILFGKFNKNNIYLLAIVSLILLIVLKDNTSFNYILYPFCIGFMMIFLVYFVKNIQVNFDFSYSLYILDILQNSNKRH